MNFEWLARAFRAGQAPEGEARHAFPIYDERVYGARGPDGEFELFLEGPRPDFGTAPVGVGLKHGTFNDTHRSFEALQVSIRPRPEAADLAALIALKAWQILHARPKTTPSELFDELYAYISLVVRPPVLSIREQMGLASEILFLHQLVSCARAHSLPAANALDAWKGYTSGARDFLRNGIAVEVKATANAVRQHRITRIEQLDPRPEEGPLRLFLYSTSQRPDASSPARLINSIRAIEASLAAVGLDGVFMDDLLPKYGSTGARVSRATAAYYELEVGLVSQFSPALFRIDESIGCLRKRDFVRGRPPDHVLDPEYTLSLPHSIRDGVNPLSAAATEEVLLEMLT